MFIITYWKYGKIFFKNYFISPSPRGNEKRKIKSEGELKSVEIWGRFQDRNEEKNCRGIFEGKENEREENVPKKKWIETNRRGWND